MLTIGFVSGYNRTVCVRDTNTGREEVGKWKKCHMIRSLPTFTQVSDNALHGVTAGSTALTSVTGLVPAGADEVSAQAATAFTSEGIQLLASNASAQDQLHRAGEAVQDVARTYSQIDDGAAGVFA